MHLAQLTITGMIIIQYTEIRLQHERITRISKKFKLYQMFLSHVIRPAGDKTCLVVGLDANLLQYILS